MSAVVPSRPRQLRGLVAWLALCFVAAGIGGIGSADAPVFYAQLTRPAWAPPAWLLPLAWSLLYVMMAVSAWLVWRLPPASPGRPAALALFVAQLVANALWSWVFFAWRQGGAAFVEAMVLTGLVAATLVAFLRLHRVAAMLMVPYLLWVAFATALNWALWRANPTLLG